MSAMADDSRKKTGNRGGRAGAKKKASRTAGAKRKAPARKSAPKKAAAGKAAAGKGAATKTPAAKGPPDVVVPPAPEAPPALAPEPIATVPLPSPVPATRAAAAPADDPLGRFFYRQDAGPTATAAAPAPAASATEDEAGREYLTFWLGDEVYAVPVVSLREIVRPLPVTEVPRTPDFVLGVVTLRGTVLPVFDLRLRLRLPTRADGRDTRVLVLDSDDGPAGIVADRVDQVVRAAGDLEIAPQALGTGSEHIEGLLRRDGRMIIVLDLETALKVETRRTRETA